MKKGKDFETDYFLREDLNSKHKLEHDQKKKEEKEHDEKLKALHYMKCPKCGHDLETKRISYIDVDQCSSCGVLVLEAENVERFIAEEKSILKSLIDFFK
jgi:ribosomal protein L32